MKTFRFILLLLVTVTLGYFLNRKINPAPPIGNFFSPFTGFWRNAQQAQWPASELLRLYGLRDKVSVTYDKHHFPHIFATNNHDLYFAQGYVTASDRLWQMEFLSIIRFR